MKTVNHPKVGATTMAPHLFGWFQSPQGAAQTPKPTHKLWPLKNPGIDPGPFLQHGQLKKGDPHRDFTVPTFFSGGAAGRGQLDLQIEAICPLNIQPTHFKMRRSQTYETRPLAQRTDVFPGHRQGPRAVPHPAPGKRSSRHKAGNFGGGFAGQFWALPGRPGAIREAQNR